jgi:hypothetical protein
VCVTGPILPGAKTGRGFADFMQIERFQSAFDSSKWSLAQGGPALQIQLSDECFIRQMA